MIKRYLEKWSREAAQAQVTVTPMDIPYSAVNSMFARLGTDNEIRNQWFFVILEAMATDQDFS